MNSQGTVAVLYLVAIGLFLAVFMLPTVIAFRRCHPNRWLILAVNFMLGGTGIGWAFALVWALDAAYRDAAGGTATHFFGDDEQGAAAGSAADSLLAPTRLTSGEAVAEIERLGRLRAGGYLDEVEFANLKAAVLARL